MTTDSQVKAIRDLSQAAVRVLMVTCPLQIYLFTRTGMVRVNVVRASFEGSPNNFFMALFQTTSQIFLFFSWNRRKSTVLSKTKMQGLRTQARCRHELPRCFWMSSCHVAITKKSSERRACVCKNLPYHSTDPPWEFPCVSAPYSLRLMCHCSAEKKTATLVLGLACSVPLFLQLFAALMTFRLQEAQFIAAVPIEFFPLH